jgi:CRISPR/Cas system CSM-associated protein Csm3 (group 7 of RAMP superfamily)
MARRIASRLLISGSLVSCGPLHVGGAENNSDVDLALAVNGSGAFYVPGTSLAGAIRGWLSCQLDEKTVNGVWGFQKESEKEAEQGFASFVFVEDGIVKLPPGTVAETRDGVGIDRVFGAAAEGVKYDRAVLPAGTEIKLDITVELAAGHELARHSILTALRAMQLEKIRFGAAKTRGLGRVRLKDDLTICEQELNSFRGMLNTLRKDGRMWEVEKITSLSLTANPVLDIKIHWVPRGPVMVKAEHAGVSVDMLPLVSAHDSDLTFVLPGSSIKGVLRSQAERIVRTVYGINAPRVISRDDFMGQIEMRNGDGKQERELDTPASRLIGDLFGSRGNVEMDDEEPLAHGPLPGLGALTVEDCYASCRFTPQQWEEIETAPNANDKGESFEGHSSPLQTAVAGAGLPDVQQSFHVAIDRWTGGAADGFLYTVLEPHGLTWEPIQLTIDLSRLLEKDQHPAVMCLLLTLRDLVAGRIPVGFAVNRGMGSIEVTDIEFTPENLNSELNQLQEVRIINGKMDGVSSDLKVSLERAWANWLEGGGSDSLRAS